MEFSKLVAQIRQEKGLSREVPGFDPKNGNEAAKFLFLLEAPGPQAVKSGMVSFENNDPTARNLDMQLKRAEIQREEIALWNIVPWYLGNQEQTLIRAAKGNDLKDGLEYLKPLLHAMPRLHSIILVGVAARRAHVFLSHFTKVRIFSCHHTSAKVMNTQPTAAKENIEIFCHLKQLSDSN